MKKILFVCENNMVRSPISELLARKIIKKKKLDKKIKVTSAGTSKKFIGIHQEEKIIATKVAKKFGIDLTKHRGKFITKCLIKSSDLILVFERNHKNKIIQISPESENKIFLIKEFLGYKKVENIKDLGNSLKNHTDFINMMNTQLPRILAKLL